MPSPHIPEEAVRLDREEVDALAQSIYESWFDGAMWHHASHRNRQDIRAGIVLVLPGQLAKRAKVVRKQERERWEINALREWLQKVAEGEIGPTDVLLEAEGWLLSLAALATQKQEEASDDGRQGS